MAAELNRYLEAVSSTTPFSGSVLVAWDGEILVRAGYGLASRELAVANSPETRFRIGSLTKTFTALGVLQLCDKEALNLADPVSTFLPGYPKGDKLTVEMLLNHTSGLPPDWREDWHEKRHLDLSEVIELFKDLPLVSEPGQEEHYSNPGYALLARIIEVVSGQSFDDYMEQEILGPLGMTSTGTDYLDRITPGRALGYVIGTNAEGIAAFSNAPTLVASSLLGQASMASTIDDLHLYDRAFRSGKLTDGKCSGLALTRSDPSEFTLGSWWTEEESPLGELIYFSGISSGFESVMYRSAEVVIIILANNQSANVFAIADSLSAILTGGEYNLPEVRAVTQWDSSLASRYSGQYEFSSDEAFRILAVDGRLFVESHGDPPEEIFPAAGGEFFSSLHDLQILFVGDSEGGPEAALWTYRGDQEKATRVVD